ncbi:MAG: uroporphyrinogen decarboxylase [Acidobacteriota bacterium]|nr:uroporphyrinogen decarboxylase [Acidobacteriota bacterium]MDE3138527.1 uroporphyrinogen decarboxylase [Acidobacteriota bacterium]
MGRQRSPVNDPVFLRACRGESVDRVPVWFMRQAGRSLPEYRALRGTGSILDAIADPALACEVTLQPVRRYGVDAAVLFSDIVVPYHAIDFGVDVVPGRGPVIAQPFRDASDLARLRDLTDADVAHVTQTVDLVVESLAANDTPLIGFAGAPFTVASYLVEGAPTRDFAVIKTLMHADPALFDRLLDRLVAITVAFLRAQVAHGARALQLFDSWAGSLTRDEYARFALPATQRVVEAVADLDVPTILFGVGTGELLTLMSSAGTSVMGIDWRVDLDEGRRRCAKPVQGNLDPARCLGGVELGVAAAREVLKRAGTESGYIFNLGHGVLPATDPEVLEAVVRVVHDEGMAGVR